MNESTKSAQTATLETVVSALLGTANHTEEKLLATIETYRATAAPDLSDDDCSELARRLIARLSIDVERGVALTADDYDPWLSNRRRSISWTHWITYKQLLLSQKFPPKVVDEMDRLTDDILDLAGDPEQQGSWQRRGLVLGDVQSGKTASYLALFNKAADAGYRLIIVLAGQTESLRQQTQKRLDEGFIGRDSSVNVVRRGTTNIPTRTIGVGLINRTVTGTIGMTTAARDFTPRSHEAISITVTNDAPHPYVFVVKKNKHVLAALAHWLTTQQQTQQKLDIPLLLLDDESDYASVNTSDETNPTAINDAIRKILSQFHRSSYVAFTATPFANIFIDHSDTDDLFPQDFIYSLESPSNYVGAKRVFGTDDNINTENVREIADAESVYPFKHKSTLVAKHHPASLAEAIRTFFVANAIRDLRGHDKPRSMLVNVSRFKRVQQQVFESVRDEVAEIKNAVDLHLVMYEAGRPNEAVEQLQKTYEKEFCGCGFTWAQVADVLSTSIADIRVQVFNSDTDKRLQEAEAIWDRPQRLIAVGGDVLSRGLTLEGLMTSYFYRRTMASDTLLQMARWFGYRDGYEDLCRIWIDPLVAADYRFVAESVDELRADLRSMLSQRLTPKDFGLAVRKHPGSLLVTAKNKMRAAETKTKTISLLGRRIESTKLDGNVDTLRANLDATVELLAVLEKAEGEINHISTPRRYNWWTPVPKTIIAEFLAKFVAHKYDEIFSQRAISRFVSSTTSAAFRNWDVVLINGSRDQPETQIGTVHFFPPRRKLIAGEGGQIRLGGASARLAGADDLTNVIRQDRWAAARKLYQEENPAKSVPESIYYPLLERPALFIYALKDNTPLDADDRIDLGGVAYIIALKLAFPGSRTDVGNKNGDVEYVVNSVAVQNWFPDYADSAGDDDDES